MTHPANNSYPPQRVPEAAMIEWAEEHGPHVNTPAPWDDALEGVATIVVGLWAVFLCLGLVLAMVYAPAWGVMK